ncbi:MAG: hypothetical protein ACJ749_17895 [Flavisolibacter sp.]
MKYLFYIFTIGLVCCNYRPESESQVRGYVPVYASAQSVTTIANEPLKPTVHAGKIYAYGNYLFQVEQNEGIHVIDNTNPQDPHKISFIKIPACSEMAIRSNFLYTNNMDDLVVFDLNNMNSPQPVSRIKGAFPQLRASYPPFSGVFFECVDPSKGVVVGWEEKLIQSPRCQR